MTQELALVLLPIGPLYHSVSYKMILIKFPKADHLWLRKSNKTPSTNKIPGCDHLRSIFNWFIAETFIVLEALRGRS